VSSAICLIVSRSPTLYSYFRLRFQR